MQWRHVTSTTITNVTITAITQLRGHFTKSTSKTVAQLNADICWLSEWTAPSQPYDWWKRWDLVSLWNVKSEEQVRVSGGRLFHACAAAIEKARSPRVARRVDGTCSVVVSAERRQRRVKISDVCRRLSDRYASAHNGIPEHTTRTGFAPRRATSETSVKLYWTEVCYTSCTEWKMSMLLNTYKQY